MKLELIEYHKSQQPIPLKVSLMKGVHMKQTLIAMSVMVFLSACNSDTVFVDKQTTVDPRDAPTFDFEGRYSFSPTFAEDVPEYNMDLGFEISDQNAAQFISSTLTRMVDQEFPMLEDLVFRRITAANSVFDEQNGLEPLFESGFQSRTRNCKMNGEVTIEVFDTPLDFNPDAGDFTRTLFSDCKEIVAETSQGDVEIALTTGQNATAIKTFEGIFGGNGNFTEKSSAKFSDLFDLSIKLFDGDAPRGELKQQGRNDFSVDRTLGSTTSFTATTNRNDVFLDAMGKVTFESGEVSQRELVTTDSSKRIRIQVLTFSPGLNSSSIDEPFSTKYSTEQERSISADVKTEVGQYNQSGDPYHPGNPIVPLRTGLTKGGLVALGKNGKVELVFDQEPVQGFTNIVRVIKTQSSVVTHDCKIPYFSVYAGQTFGIPRFSFGENGVCLVDGQVFPPVASPPQEPPVPPVSPQPACFVRDLTNTISDNDPTPVTSSLSAAINPVVDLLCGVVEPLQTQSPF